MRACADELLRAFFLRAGSDAQQSVGHLLAVSQSRDATTTAAHVDLAGVCAKS